MSQGFQKIRHFRKCLRNSRNVWGFLSCLGISGNAQTVPEMKIIYRKKLLLQSVENFSHSSYSSILPTFLIFSYTFYFLSLFVYIVLRTYQLINTYTTVLRLWNWCNASLISSLCKMFLLQFCFEQKKLAEFIERDTNP